MDEARVVAELASITKCTYDACHWETFAFLIPVDHGTGAEPEVGERVSGDVPLVGSGNDVEL